MLLNPQMITGFFHSYGLYIGRYVNTVLPSVLVRDRCHETKMQFTDSEEGCRSVCMQLPYKTLAIYVKAKKILLLSL